MIEDHIKFDAKPKMHDEKDYDEEMEDVVEDLISEICSIIGEDYENLGEIYSVLGTLQECLVSEKCEPDIVDAINEIKNKIIPEKMNHVSILNSIIIKLAKH